MAVYIVVHSKDVETVRKLCNYLADKLDDLYTGKVYTFHRGTVLDVDNRITIDFRCGTDIDKFGGLTMDFYYTDADEHDDIFAMLEMGACKRNGKRLTNIDQVIHIVEFYMNMFDEIDRYLEEKEK